MAESRVGEESAETATRATPVVLAVAETGAVEAPGEKPAVAGARSGAVPIAAM